MPNNMLGEERLYLVYTSWSTRKAEPGTQAKQEASERIYSRDHKRMKFTDLLFIALSDYFLYTTQNQLAKFDTTPNEMRPSLSVINQENSSQSSIQANLKETFSQPRFPISRKLLICQVDKNATSIMTFLSCPHFLVWFELTYKCINLLSRVYWKPQTP